MSNVLNYTACFGWWLPLLFGLLGFGLGWLFFKGKKQVGDLSVEGEGALRAEADSLRARVQELEGRVSTRDGEVSTLKGKLAAAAAGAAVAGGAAAVASKGDDDETYALEWRNRYLAARVKYLEGRVAEAPKKKAAPKKRVTAKKAPAKRKAAPKPKAKAKPKPKVLYKDGPTDGPKDDLKLIKGIGPKFEGDLNGKGIYYFRQIANWKAADVTMVEGVIESIPGRIKRDEWVPQAKGLAKGGKARATKAAPKARKPKAKAKAASKPKVLYTDGPTDGPKDDLKLIKGIGPKFEGDLNGKGIYYFRQIGNWKAADVTMVEGVIESIPGRIKRDEWVRQAKGLAKGSSAKASTGKKKPGPKPGTKRGNLTAAGKVRKKPGPKAGSAKPKVSDKEAKFEKYFTNVRKYDSRAKRDVVQNIVKYCGVALSTRDGSLVACSDEAEVKRVAAGFATKKLGLKSGQLDLVQGVCTQMKPDRFKSRVTFYYLAAKKAGKLGIFGG